MEYIYENPGIARILSTATELHLLHCRKMSEIAVELPEGLDFETRDALTEYKMLLGIYARVYSAPTLILTQAVEDTPDNRRHMQRVLESTCLDLNIPGVDHVHGLDFAAGVPGDNPLLRQAQDLRQTYGSALKLGIFKGASQSPLGWTTLDNLDMQDITEFLERGYVLKPYD